MDTAAIREGTTMTRLRAWQREALNKWKQLGYRGVVEAVTGSGKTEVGIAAAIDAVHAGKQVLVVVPTRDLMQQWYERLSSTELAGGVGRRGDTHKASFQQCDVVVSTIHSAVADHAEQPTPGALLVADEVHRYGAESFSRVLDDSVFEQRLGLTATLERADDGIDRVLMPFFETTISGCTFERGYADGILAQVNVALVPVPFSPQERVRYDNLDEIARSERTKLIGRFGCREEPFGLLLKDAQSLAREDPPDPATRSARLYLKAFSERRDLLASAGAKEKALKRLAAGLGGSGRTLVFAETKSAAVTAAEALLANGIAAAPFTSDLPQRSRQELLQEFRVGNVTALAAPRVLDEGIDVPEADVGVVLAASRSRRQMIQRMGRVLRPKPDGRPAVFVVMYVEGSAEDPELGAHETFLDMLIDIAATREIIEPDGVAAVLRAWLPVKTTTTAKRSDEAHGLAAEATAQIAERTATIHRRSGQIRGAVVDATKSARPDELDTVLAALVDLRPVEADAVILRFGLAGDVPLELDTVANELNMSEEETRSLLEEALVALQLTPEGGSETDTAPVPNDATSEDAEDSVAPGDLPTRRVGAVPTPLDVLTRDGGVRAAAGGASDSKAHWPSTPVLDHKPIAPSQPFGLRHISLPSKSERDAAGKDAQTEAHASSTPKPRRPAPAPARSGLIRVEMDCGGGIYQAGVFDPVSGTVRLDYPVKGRRDFENPRDAAVALIQFYDDELIEPFDGWARWTVKGSGESLSDFRGSGRSEPS